MQPQPVRREQPQGARAGRPAPPPCLLKKLDHILPESKTKKQKGFQATFGFTAHEAKQGGIGFKSLTGSHTMRPLHAVVRDPFSPLSNLTASHLTSPHLSSSHLIIISFPFHLIPSHRFPFLVPLHPFNPHSITSIHV